jgi:hypothetical protein
VDLPWSTSTEIRDLWEPRGFRQRALSFFGFGLIAGASGVALIALDSDSGHGSAFEAALVQTPSVTTAASAEAPLVHAALAPEIRDLDGVTREIAKRENPTSCPDALLYEAENRCGSDVASNPENATPVSSPSNLGTPTLVSNPPLSAVVPTSDVENTPTTEVNATLSTDAGPTGVEVPALKVLATTERKRVRQQPSRGRYAQQRHFWPFW